MENINKIFEENVIYNICKSEIIQKKNCIEGNIEAELIVFYNSAEGEFLNEKQKEFLMKMLGAVKHNLENTLIVSDKEKISFEQFVKKGTVKKMMFFGSAPKGVGLNLNIKRYKIYNFQEIELLFIDQIHLIQEDSKRKSALWNLMKTLFNIS